ncbi:MAG: NADPH-dependent F420 reductase [Candidatus Methylomirabilales bacterium]
MNIGIIGSGNVGKALGETWLKKGHQVLFSYSRDLQKLRAYSAGLGGKASAGTPAEAVQFGEVILFAPPWPAVEDALRAAGSLTGKILVDCTNPLKPDLSGLAIGHTTSAAEELARRVAGTRVVKAFNTTGAENMKNPQFGSQRATMFICGDDAAAKSVVSGLARDAGFEVVDAGSLSIARLLEPLAMLWIHLAYGQKMGTGFAFTLLRR